MTARATTWAWHLRQLMAEVRDKRHVTVVERAAYMGGAVRLCRDAYPDEVALLA